MMESVTILIEWLAPWAFIGIWLAGQGASTVTSDGFKSLKNFLKKISPGRDLLNKFIKIIDEIKNDEDIDSDTISELNRLKNNLRDFKPAIDKLSDLSDLPLEQRRKAIIAILHDYFAERYSIRDDVLNKIIENFIDSAFEIFKKYVKSDKDQLLKEIFSTSERIERQNQELAKQYATFWNNVMPCDELKKYLTSIDKKLDICADTLAHVKDRSENIDTNTQKILEMMFELNKNFIKNFELFPNNCDLTKWIDEKINDGTRSILLKGYTDIFANIYQDTHKQQKDRIIESLDLIKRINTDKEIHRNQSFWIGIENQVEEIEFFLYHNLQISYFNLLNYPESLEYGNKALDISKKLKITEKILSRIYGNKAVCNFFLDNEIDAINGYKKAIELDPQQKNTRINYSVTLISNGNLGEAEEQVKKALEIDPLSENAHVVYSYILLKQDILDKAEKELKIALGFNPKLSLPYLLYSDIYIKRGDLTEAGNQLKQAIKTNPNSGDAHSKYAFVRLACKDIIGAKKCIEKAIEIDPQSSEYHNRLSIILFYLKKYPEAEKALRKSIELNHSCGDSYLLLSIILTMEGNYAEAKNHALKAIQYSPENSWCYIKYAMLLLQTKKDQSVRKKIQKVIKLIPKSSVVQYNFGNYLVTLGLLKEAQILLKGAIELDPLFKEAELEYANLLYNSGKNDDAEEHYKKSIELGPSFFKAYFDYSLFLVETRRFDKVEPYLIKAADLNPKSSDIQYMLASHFEYIKKDDEKALFHYKKSIENDQKFTLARFYYANLLLKTQKLESGRDQLKMVIEIDPTFAEAQFYYGLILLDFGNYNEAIYNIEHAFQRNPRLKQFIGKNKIKFLFEKLLFEMELRQSQTGVNSDIKQKSFLKNARKENT